MKKNKRNKEHIYKVGEIVNGELEIIKKTRNKFNCKSYIVKSLIFPDAPYYNIDESNIKKGTGCAYKNNKRIYEGNSLYSIEWIRSYLIDVEQSKRIAPGSNSKIKLRCPTCKQEKYVSPSIVLYYGFSCSYCNKNTSYPEQFFLAYSKVKHLLFEHQQTLSGSSRRFDFVDYKNKIIVETHGKQHYDKNDKWYKSSQEQDRDKKIYSKENGWVLIELDCSVSSFEYIKQSINNCSFLPSIKQHEEIEILNFIEYNKRYPTKEIIKMYLSGNSTYEISTKLNINQSTVSRILSKNNILLRDSHEMSRKKVRCINTGEIFNSVSDAQKFYNIGNISPACNGKRKSAGILNGEPLQWEFLE